MAKGRGVDLVLERLGALRGTAPTPEARGLIAKGLDSSVSFVAAKSADLAREMKLEDLCPQFPIAFNRFLPGNKGEDKGCAAKTAIARAALELECGAEELFRAGVRHVQMEGSYGGAVDVAAELRGLCGMGLVQVRYRDVMNELADLLTDSQPQARIGAVRALAYAGREDGALLLRFKVHTGDSDSAVIGECLAALLQLQPDQSLPLVERLLDSPREGIREEAALALGSSKRPEAFEVLRRHYSARIEPGFRPTLLLAIASSRDPQAVEFLAKLVETERPAAAADAIAALRIYRNDAALRARLALAVEKRAEESLLAVFGREFGN